MGLTSFYPLLFYGVAAVILLSTGLAITRRNPVHAVVYLALSFLGSAFLFYLLGAPILAALEVIVYAGAIMVLFLFVVMMLRPEISGGRGLSLRQWMPACLMGVLFFTIVILMVFRDAGSPVVLEMAMAAPKEFGRFLFERYWIPVEIISLLLLIALMAAILLGKGKGRDALEGQEEKSQAEEEEG